MVRVHPDFWDFADHISPLEMKELGTEVGAGNLAICEVLRFHVDEAAINEKQRIDCEKLDLIGRNGGYYFTRANKDALFELKRP